MGRQQKRSRKLSTTPARRTQTRPTVDPVVRRFPEWLTFVLTVPIAAVLAVGGTFLVPFIGPWWTLLISVIVILLYLVFAVKNKGTRKWLALALSLIMVLVVGVWFSEERAREVDRFYDGVRTADGWVAPPVMYDDSRQFLIDHFEAFNDQPHGWDELPDAAPASLLDVATNALQYSGRAIYTTGLGIGGGRAGNQLIVQIQPLESPDVKKLANNEDFTLLVPDSDQRDELLANPVKDSDDALAIVACQITPRPFVFENPGYYWTVKGVVVGYGRWFRRDQKIEQVAYMWCSSAERVPVS